MAKKGIIWENIEKEGFVSYDGLVKIIKDTFSPTDNRKANISENKFNALFVKVMEKLEEEY